MKCDGCGKTFRRGNYIDGTPNGMTFVLDTKDVTLCRGCIIKLGMMSKQDKNEWLKNLVGEENMKHDS